MITPNCIIFVDNWTDAAQACTDIKHYSVIGIDIELIISDDNNVVKKTTSLIQVAISPYKTYIFDALTLGQALFDACYLLPILVNPQILKLCYDCRGDTETLFINHGVRAFGLYDLQIVFTSLFQTPMDPFLKGLNRAVRAVLSPEEANVFWETKARMKRYFIAETETVSILKNKCLLPVDDCKKKQSHNNENKKKNCKHHHHNLIISTPPQQIGHKKRDIMSVRPLSKDTLRYCAEDAALLLRMYSAWSSNVDINDVIYATLKRAEGHIFRSPHLGKTGGMHYIDFEMLACGSFYY